VGKDIVGSTDENVVIEDLFSADAGYSDDLEYELFPQASVDGYNSNSYTHGLLNAVGLIAPTPTHNVPGYSKPVPSTKFGARSHTSNGGNRKAQESKKQQTQKSPSKGSGGGTRHGHVTIESTQLV